MRDIALARALREFVQQAAFQLAADTDSSGEVPFDIVAEPGPGTPLYCYRPLTDSFIADHFERLKQLPTYVGAIRALERVGNLERYLGSEETSFSVAAAAALRQFVQRLFADSSSFEFSEERFEVKYRELELALFSGSSRLVFAAPLHGVELQSQEVVLSSGTALVRRAAAPDVPHGDWFDAGEVADTLLVISTERCGDLRSQVHELQVSVRRLLTGLRLFEGVSSALAPVGWLCIDHGPWQMVVLQGAGVAGTGSHPFVLHAQQEDEFRAFCNLVAKRIPHMDDFAFALRRFELGCERSSRLEALTDYLVALRALLEPEGSESGLLPVRLGAICALPEERQYVTAEITEAVVLEQAVVAGEMPSNSGAIELAELLGEYLRSVLRDAICGHLGRNLCAVADGILAEAAAEAPTGSHELVAH